jgi:transcriptional regulator with XRE-family HTH domain
MTEKRVPSWFTVLRGRSKGQHLYDVFADVLHNLPMTSTELARRLDVSQPAISRWASGAAHPSLEQMEATLKVVGERLLEIKTTTERAAEVFALLDRAVLVSECQCESPNAFCETCSVGSTAVREELASIESRLAGLIQGATARLSSAETGSDRADASPPGN